jgi:creatinine amidohydrolase/Fe(II)-dependent formamide hydrolase-like protein
VLKPTGLAIEDTAATLALPALNSHGGNAAILEVVLAEFQSKHPTLQTVLVTYWNVAIEELQRMRESPLGGMGEPAN